MQNVDMKVEGSILTIKVDLTQSYGASKSGKTIIVASTQGNVPVGIATNGIRIGLNVYQYPPR